MASVSNVGTSLAQASTAAWRDTAGDIHFNDVYGDTGVRSTGHLYLDYQSETGSIAIDEASENGFAYHVTTGASNLTITLEAVSGKGDKVICITKADTGTGTVIIDGSGTETVGGKTTFTLYTFGDCVWLQCNGSTGWQVIAANMSPVVIAKSTSFTVDDQPFTTFYYNIDTSGGNVTATLPAVSGLTGRRYHFQKSGSGSNNIIIDGSGAETIGGAATKTSPVTQYSAATIYVNGVAWFAESYIGTWT